MIVAYCDQCGEKISADFPAAVRLLIGKEERVFHLCVEHQEGFKNHLHNNVLLKNQGRVNLR